MGHVFGTGKKAVRKRVQGHIAFLERERETTDAHLGEVVQQSPAWRERAALVQRGGPVRSRTLLADFPERGDLSRRAIAKLVGVAPLSRDSGTMRGRRFVPGGRATVRAVLYRAALTAPRRTPVITTFYERLVTAGTAQKLALVACRRQLLPLLNVMVRTGTRGHAWRTEPIVVTA